MRPSPQHEGEVRKIEREENGSAEPMDFGWSILELMGHRRLAGKLCEVTLAGGVLLRLDVPTPDGAWVTQFYSGAAVYCITPTTEEIARAVARGAQPAPVHRYELPAPSSPVTAGHRDGGDEEAAWQAADDGEFTLTAEERI